MKAIQVHEFGGPEVLKLEEIPTPQPAAGQALVRIHAAGVNPYDTYMRNGTYAIKPPLPYTPGSDGAGIVEAVGSGVGKVKLGDRVYVAKTVTGAYAEYAIALESQVHRLPEKVSFTQGAGVWVPYGTAYHALYHSAQAHASEIVLIHGASGGVGIAGVQIARASGLTVFGTASSQKGLDLVMREGAHQVFNHSEPGYLEEIMKATGGRGVGHRPRNARQRESRQRHEASRHQRPRHRHRQPRRNHRQSSRPHEPARLGSRLQPFGRLHRSKRPMYTQV